METRLSQLHSSDAKEREIRKYSKIESQHLRLRRTKIKLEDFRTVKVIGKGAFGEVRTFNASSVALVGVDNSLGSIGAKGRYREGLRNEESAKI